jgi:hypothetical protein
MVLCSPTTTPEERDVLFSNPVRRRRPWRSARLRSPLLLRFLTPPVLLPRAAALPLAAPHPLQGLRPHSLETTARLEEPSLGEARPLGREIRYRQRKCLHLYHYQVHPAFGFMHARIQTWFPFRVWVCINGREWLARQMDQAQLHYLRRHNTFTWLQDVAAAQTLFDQQLRADWPGLLGGLADALNPAHAAIFAQYPCRYYWSVNDSE